MSKKFYYYRCEECDWDTIRDRGDIGGPCPICAEDYGREGIMIMREATSEDGTVEGRDDRKESQ